MPTPQDDSFEALEARLRTILPQQYHASEPQPIPMGSAGLRFAPDGRVAWNEIWGSFCDLAMAGGPPHKGKLLQAATAAEIASEPIRYQQVTDEICRGITLATGLAAEPAPDPGWIRVACPSHTMAGWLLRAITMENVAIRSCEGATLDLPAGPSFRLEKEIKNVITVTAKTSHYWQHHMPASQQREIAILFASSEAQYPLIQPADDINARWQAVDCPTITAAIWIVRRLIATNVLARREETTLFLPLNPITDPNGEALNHRLTQLRAFAKSKGIL